MNNKIALQTLKGFRDFLPEEARKRQWLRNKMIGVFEKWGYEPLESPTLEALEIFKGQIGEDEKLFFQFKDPGGRDVALRYDQTVPSCRIVGQYENLLTFPFRRYQIQSNFRAEKPQKGRYREFTQADIDIFGIKSSIADAECIAISLDLYRTLGFKNPLALINNRDLLKDIPYSAISAIDKLRKIGKEEVLKEMLQKGITKEKSMEYFNFIENLKPDKTIETIFDYLKKTGFPDDWYQFDPTLARSFSYSQGPIWEIKIPDYSAGSVGGGERYDKLVENISGKKIPATGIAFGFDRTLEACQQLNLVPIKGIVTQVLVTIFSPELLEQSIKISSALRTSGINCETFPDPETKLDKQLKYADKKGIPFVVILGPDEITNNTLTIKNMINKTQEQIDTQKLVSYIKEQTKL